jgi:hypothetical protein
MANTKTRISKTRGLPPWIADQSACPRIPLCIPDGPPAALLPPGEEPEITLDEMIDVAEFGRLYYQRSGRYLGVFSEYRQVRRVDEYYYARQFLPGGRLPWE